ncbi:hypothetical protein RQP46_003285 [Phenoliferia psychrophenolica]
MNALVLAQPGTLVIKKVPIPVAGLGEIVVQTRAVALNPTVGSILGCDYSGIVLNIGEGVTTVKKGDRVAGLVHGGSSPDTGAFADFIKTDAAVTWTIPDDISFEEAAAMGGVGTATAFHVLYAELGLAKPDAPLTTPEPFLIWGGATSVGLYVIQLAKMSGYTVIVTCSPKSNDLVKSLGADAVYPYSDPETPSKISAAYPTLALALDAVSSQETTAQTSQSLGKSASILKRVIKLSGPLEGDAAGLAVRITMTLAYMLLGKPFNKFGKDFPAVPSLRHGFEGWNAQLAKLIKGGLKSNPLWIQEGGLAKVNDGLELLKQNKVSGQKVVYLL